MKLPEEIRSIVIGATAGLGLTLITLGAACYSEEAPVVRHGATAAAATATLPPGASPASAPAARGAAEEAYPVPKPPFSEGVFPCSECHADLETNTKRRKLEEHQKIRLNHGPRERWCFDCHDPKNRDKLRLASGTLVPFSRSYRLCGQCHGPKLRDWRVGVHGKRTGRWDGRKRYLLCAHCHDPHSPRFKPIKPLPPPARPENIR